MRNSIPGCAPFLLLLQPEPTREIALQARFIHPETEWRRSYRADLSIIDDELWQKVKEERERKGCAGHSRSGGLNRTNKSRTYFLSGLLICGVCGANYNLRSHGRYCCAAYMWHNSCSNSATFRREDIERSLISSLCEKLRSPAQRKTLAQSVFAYLKSEKAKHKQQSSLGNSRKIQLQSALRAEEMRRDNLVRAIAVGGDLSSLVDTLAGSESEVKLLAKVLSELAPSAQSKELRINEIREFVDRHADSFEGILLGAAETLKIEFQRRVSPALSVTPIDTKEGYIFRVTGGIGLFSPAEGAMLSDRVNQIGQHCTIRIDINIPLYCPRKHQRCAGQGLRSPVARRRLTSENSAANSGCASGTD